METPYLTKRELCEYLKVSRWVIERLMREGLPHFPLGRRVLFKREDVDSWLKKKKLVK
ncbi:MAG: excisionase family DNA-binding protein [Acidobacteria bacterium]|nr:excisionase family DNA-binding protein [Acidobacteriota bacterium]